MIFPASSFATDYWYVAGNLANGRYPSGIVNDDILIIQETALYDFVPLSTTSTLVEDEYTETTGQGTDNDPFISNFRSKARVSWRTNGAGLSGATIGGNAFNKRCTVLRRTNYPNGSSDIKTAAITTTNNLDVDYDYTSEGLLQPTTPLLVLAYAGPTGQTEEDVEFNGTAATKTSNITTNSVGTGETALFYPNPTDRFRYATDMNWSATSDKSPNWRAFVIRRL